MTTTDIMTLLEEVEHSDAFKEFSKENPTHYLVHVFSMMTIHNRAPATTSPEFGYYGESSDRITVFKTSPVVRMPEEDVFKSKETIPRLTVGAQTLSVIEGFKRAEEERAKLYPRHEPMKAICILQQQEIPIWNITIITQTLQMANFRIDATTGAVLKSDIQSLMNLSAD